MSNNIKFDEDLLLENITRFMQYAALKNNSKLIDEHETPASRLFGEYLLKYYDEELDNDDIRGLCQLINLYNNAVDTKLEDDNEKKKILGAFLKNDENNKPAGKSLLDELYNLYLETIKTGTKETVNSDGETSFGDTVDLSDKLVIANTTTVSVPYTKEAFFQNNDNDEASPFYEFYTAASNNDNLKIKSPVLILTEYLNSLKIKTAVREISMSPDDITSYIYKDEKRSASFEERHLTGKNESYAVIDLVLKGDSIEKIYSSTTTESSQNDPLRIRRRTNTLDTLGITLYDTIDISDNSYVSFSILYKELNPDYRVVGKSLENELLLENYLSNSSTYNNNKTDSDGNKIFVADELFITTKKESENGFNTSLYQTLREQDLSENAYFSTDEIKSIQQWYSNPYNIRKGEESALVGYYIGSSVFNKSSDGTTFGSQQNEKNNIYNFIEIYDETRYYFYRVLLNESFVNEPEYNIFEKLYITTYAIDRFLNKKIEYAKDISTFTKKDYINFFETFGLKRLSDKIQEKSFSSALDSMNIIAANYAELMSTKGSRAVIRKIIKSFSDENSTLDVRKYTLVQNITSDNNGNNKSTYGFIESEYLPENVSQDLITKISSLQKYNDFVKDDPYWKLQDSSSDDFTKLNVDVLETKYLALDLKKNIYKSYIMYNYLIAVLNRLIDIKTDDNKVNKIGNLKISSEYINTNDNTTIFKTLIYRINAEISEIFKNNTQYFTTITKNETKDKLYNFLGIKNNIDNYIELTEADDQTDKEVSLSINSSINDILEPIVGEKFVEPLKKYILGLEYGTDNHEWTSHLNDDSALTSKTLVNAVMYMMAFPIEYFDGLTTDYIDNDKMYSHNIRKIIEMLLEIHTGSDSPFKNITNDLKLVNEKDTTGIDDAEEIYNIHASNLLTLGDILSANFSSSEYMGINIIYIEDVSNELEFLTLLIDEFISYTSTIHSSTASYRYDTTSEGFNLSDCVVFKIDSSFNDVFFYDEKLTIQKTSTSEGTTGE